jgi:hypothetical protein
MKQKIVGVSSDDPYCIVFYCQQRLPRGPRVDVGRQDTFGMIATS